MSFNRELVPFYISNFMFSSGMPAVEKGPDFNTGPYGILNSGYLYARGDQKVVIEHNFHEPRSSNGKD